MVHLLTPFGLHIYVPCWFSSLAAMTNISFSKGRIISSCGAKSLDTLFDLIPSAFRALRTPFRATWADQEPSWTSLTAFLAKAPWYCILFGKQILKESEERRKGFIPNTDVDQKLEFKGLRLKLCFQHLIPILDQWVPRKYFLPQASILSVSIIHCSEGSAIILGQRYH